jgi:hypothetical protein
MIYTLKQKFIDNLIMFFLVMSAGGLLFVFNRNVMSILFFGILIFSILFFGNKFKKPFIYSSVLILISIICIGIINFIFAITEQATEKYLFYLLSVALSVLTFFHFKNNRNSNQFLKTLYFVLKLIAFHSALNFIFYFFVRDDLSTINTTFHECETFLNLFFYTTDRGIVNIEGFEFCRNQGLFWEPGVLQVFLNILFFLEAFVIKKSKLFLLFLSFVILTSYSTTGLAILLIQAIVYLSEQIKNNKLILAVITTLLVPLFFVFSVNIKDKIQGEKEGSFQKRIFDLTQPVFIAMDNPLTGVGLDVFQFQKIREEFYISSNSFIGITSTTKVTDKGSSNSVMFLLAGTGFPTSLILLYMFFKQRIIENKKWLFMIILFISVMSEPLLLRPFFLIFIISGFHQIFYRVTSHKQMLA